MKRSWWVAGATALAVGGSILVYSLWTGDGTLAHPHGCRVWEEGPVVLVKPDQTSVSVILGEPFAVVDSAALPARAVTNPGQPAVLRRLRQSRVPGHGYTEFQATRVGDSTVLFGPTGDGDPAMRRVDVHVYCS